MHLFFSLYLVSKRFVVVYVSLTFKLSLLIVKKLVYFAYTLQTI